MAYIVTSNIVNAPVPGAYGAAHPIPPPGDDLLIFLDNSFVIDTSGNNFVVPE